jgi:transglutaminase-like putative cysteine protease
VDLFGLTRVKLAGPLPQRVPAAIRFRVRGLPPAFAREDPRQQVRPAGADEVLLTVTARRPRAADPARDARRGEGPADLLAATPEIDADDPKIRALARELVGDARGAYAAATRINDAVFRRLEKAYGSSRDRASEVLAAGRGDCTEHTLLFVALARAAGVPARQVHGLVYARYADGVNALYWHAWPEVLSGDEWIALDPTFGQPVADATHVALGRGPQVDTVGLLGALEVLEAKPVG